MEQPHNAIAHRLIEQPEIRAVGFKRMIRGKMKERQRIAAAFWKELEDGGRLDALQSLGDGPILGVSTNFVNDGYDFYVCMETEEAAPEGMETLTIPGGLFAAFDCESASHDAVRARWAEIYDKWFFSSGYGHLGTAEVELYAKLDPNEPCELRAPVKRLEPKAPSRRGSNKRDRGVLLMLVCGLLFLFLGSAVSTASYVPIMFGLVGLLVGAGVNGWLKKRAEEKEREKENGSGAGE
ncbi:MAG: effector binding domain-containing protein [Eubacteriales bacterium]|nr:effector binding domain-containing protein [Eubacteriales bacterium]